MAGVIPAETRAMIKTLERQGWRVERGGKHFKAFPPDKSKPMVVMGCTPGPSAWKNMVADLRRSGADV